MTRIRIFLPFLGLLLFIATAPAAVVLVTDQSTISVAPGDSFSLTLSMEISGGSQVTGLDYFWEVSANGSGNLSLIARDIGDSLFSFLLTDPYPFPDTLDPRNSFNLGAGVDNPAVPAGNGVWLVAEFSFAVSPSATPATYGLMLAGVGGVFPDPVWVGPAPNFFSFPFDALPSISVVVIPEPSADLLFGLGGLLFLMAVKVLRLTRALLLARTARKAAEAGFMGRPMAGRLNQGLRIEIER